MEGILFSNLAASAAVLVIFLLRKIFPDKFSSAVFVLLWSLVILRLLLPFEFSSPLSIYKTREETPQYRQEQVIFIPAENAETPVLSFEEEESIPQVTPNKKMSKISTGDVLLFLWVSGVLLCGGFFTAKHLYSVRKILKNSVPFDELPEGFENGKIRFYKSGVIPSPLSFGLLRPAVIIPEQITKEHLPLVLLHEQTHIRNYDQALKTAALAALSLNWFNPFVWIMVKYLVRDMERLCDERVLSRIGDEKAPLYANTILDFAEKESLSLSFFSAGSLRERVISIMKNKQKKKCLPAVLCLFTALVIIMTACGTTPRVPEKEPSKAENLSEIIQNAADEPSELIDIENGEIAEEFKYTVPGDFNGYRVDFTWPCREAEVITDFGGYNGHSGIDIGEKEGSYIYAAAEGTVIKAGWDDNGYGYCITIDHGNEVSTFYAHCSEMYIAEGQKVEKGELIGLTGSTGNSAHPHLHFELRFGELYLDPLKHIPTLMQEKVM